MTLEITKLEKEDALNVILGRAPVPKVIDRINDAFTTNLPDLKFGLAFQALFESRSVGTDTPLIATAKANIEIIGVPHLFVLLVEDSFSMMALKTLKTVPEISDIYCATPDPVEIIITETDEGREFMGLVGDYSARNSYVDR